MNVDFINQDVNKKAAGVSLIALVYAVVRIILVKRV